MTRPLDWQVHGRCRVCDVDVHKIHEFAWMVHDVIWRKAIRRAQRPPRPRGSRASSTASVNDLCCIRCFEARLGRELRAVDFNWEVPLNSMTTFLRSKLLRDRMRA